MCIFICISNERDWEVSEIRRGRREASESVKSGQRWIVYFICKIIVCTICVTCIHPYLYIWRASWGNGGYRRARIEEGGEKRARNDIKWREINCICICVIYFYMYIYNVYLYTH